MTIRNILSFWEILENIVTVLSAELAQRVVKVNVPKMCSSSICKKKNNPYINAEFPSENWFRLTVFVATALASRRDKGITFWPRGYKTFFMLNSAEHEICFVYKS